MKNLVYLAIIIFCTNAMYGQRNVAWVHGLEGDETSWEYYNDIFDTERNIVSMREEHPSDIGINHSANHVIASMNAHFGNASNTSGANDAGNLAIGHSMGGLMVREVDRIQGVNGGPKKFGGYITVTTPNYGAPISNSLLDGSVESAAEDACDKLSSGPVTQLFGLPWSIIANLETDELCDMFITNDMVQNLQGNEDVNTDLKVGSPTINAINNYTDNDNPNIPRISIWAQEDSPVHWRMFSSEKYNSDQVLVDKMERAKNIYNTFYWANRAIAVYYTFSGFMFPWQWQRVASYNYKADQWKKGKDWIDNSENIWSSLIKTTRRESQSYWGYVWVPCAYPPSDLDPISVDPVTNREAAIDPNCGEFVWTQRTRYVSVLYPSDGLLPQYTQCLKGLSNNDGTRYKVSGANHLEVRNMSAGSVDETAVEFRRIFSRDDFFYTELRD